MMMAPGASSQTPMYLPGQGDGGRPGLDEHIAPVEDERRIEIIEGKEYSTMSGGGPGHSRPQARLAAVLVAVAAEGYTAHTELLTRHDVQSDFATDACLLREGTDPATKDRYLEEMAFEIANEQSLGNLKKKAQLLSGRGVRRVFGILAKKRQVLEWSVPRADFVFLRGDEEISDPCLAMPLLVKALVDAATAELATLKGLLNRKNPELLELALEVLQHKGALSAIEARAYRKGEGKGQRAGRAEGLKEGLKEGEDKGRRAELRNAIRGLCGVLYIDLSASRRAALSRMDLDALRMHQAYLQDQRRWPATSARKAGGVIWS